MAWEEEVKEERGRRRRRTGEVLGRVVREKDEDKVKEGKEKKEG